MNCECRTHLDEVSKCTCWCTVHSIKEKDWETLARQTHNRYLALEEFQELNHSALLFLVAKFHGKVVITGESLREIHDQCFLKIENSEDSEGVVFEIEWKEENK